MKPMISVIVPCYNAEKYIDRCLDSLLNQSIGMDNLQIILVDDASTDNTLQLLHEYESEYPDNILLISYSENRGPGGARNTGLEYAEADYIGFCDIDDWVESDMYQSLYNCREIPDPADTGKAYYDIIYCKYLRTSDTLSLQYSDRHDVNYRFTSYNGLYWGKDELKDTGKNGSFIRSCCTGIYRKDLLLNNRIYFLEGLIHEDIFWMELVSLYASNAYILDLPLYHYEYNQGSITTSLNDSRILDRLEVETRLVEEYKARNAFDRFKDKIVSEFMNRFYINTLNMLFTRFERCPNIYETMHSIIYSYFPDWDSYIPIGIQEPAIQFILNLLKARDKLTDIELEGVKIRFLELQKLK